MDHNAAPLSGFDEPIITDEQVIDRVDTLIQRDARHRGALWLTFVDAHGNQAPIIVPVDGLPEYPDPQGIDSVIHVLQHLLGRTDSAILALARPGEAAVTDFDRRWCRSLHDAARLRDVTIRMFCSVTPRGVRRLTLDDVCGPPSGWAR